MPPAIAERTRALRQSLSGTARALTAEHGLAGFTIEQLCDAVGCSRRTFFNHFASKEDAVVGIEIGTADALLDQFRAGGLVPRGTTPVETLCRAALAHIEHHGLTREAGRQFRAALEREPSLLPRAMANGEVQGRRLAEALREREGMPADDPRPAVAVAVATAIVQHAATDYFDSAHPHDVAIEDLVLAALRTAESVTAPAPTSPRSPAPMETTA